MDLPVFIKINGSIFNVRKIQAIRYEDKKNELGKDSGVYVLSVKMEGGEGNTNFMYSSKKERDDDYKEASKQLSAFSTKNIKKMMFGDEEGKGEDI